MYLSTGMAKESESGEHLLLTAVILDHTGEMSDMLWKRSRGCECELQCLESQDYVDVSHAFQERAFRGSTLENCYCYTLS